MTDELARLKEETAERRAELPENPHSRDAVIAWLEGVRDDAEAALDRAFEIAMRFEDAKVNWFTDCPSCCHLLDGNYELYVEREEARALADQLAKVLAWPGKEVGDVRKALDAYEKRGWK